MPYQQPNQGTGALVINELSQRTCESLVGRKVMTRFSDDSNFCEAIITDYDPVEVCSNLCEIHRLLCITNRVHILLFFA